LKRNVRFFLVELKFCHFEISYRLVFSFDSKLSEIYIVIFFVHFFPAFVVHPPIFEEMNYVFNGDFVDRGAHSLEVIGLLLALKVSMPNRVWLVRGNHEDRTMNLGGG